MILPALSTDTTRSLALSTTLAQVQSLPRYAGPRDESLFLDEVAGRQLLHVTFGSVLTAGADARGRKFKDGILELTLPRATADKPRKITVKAD